VWRCCLIAFKNLIVRGEYWVPYLLQKAADRPPLLSPGLKYYDNLNRNPISTYPLSSSAICRKLVMSRNGGAPNNRLYSRLNWEGLS
jgi:hypothetical protein